AYWADPHKTEDEKWWITKQLDKFNHWFNRQAQNYRKVIAWALDHRSSMIVIAAGTFFASFLLPTRGVTGLLAALLGIGIIVYGINARRFGGLARAGVIVAGVAAFIVLPRVVPAFRTVGSAFFPVDDRSEFIMKIETPPGSNLQYTRLKAEEAARIVQSQPEVRYTYTTLGEGGTGAVDVGNIYVKLVPKTDRKRSVDKLAADLRKQMARVAGATISIFENDFGAGFKQIMVQIRGQDAKVLAQVADDIFAKVKAVPGAVDVGLSSKGQKPELEIELNRGVSGALGVTVGQIAQSLRPAFAGIDAGDWVDPTGKSRDVTVRLTPESRRRAADLAGLPLVVIGPNGAPSTMPLGQVATIREGVGPAIIDHLNREPVVNVELNTSGRATGDVSADIQKIIDDMRLPPGVHITLGGDAESQAEVFGQIFAALGLAVLFMYLILVVQFGSFLDPLAIMMSLPLSLIGVMLSLAVTNYTINLMSLIGVILLMGIVAKNAILLIDFAKWAREERGVPLREALIEAGAIRLRPILMTTFALIAGMLPIAAGRGEGAQFRAPMGVAIIGGVITSTFLTLLVIPTFYEVMDLWRSKFSRRVGLSAPHTAEHPVIAPVGD
ncbi:MAG TPA: efflux RND transporter permease subunit, partial [Gemmatimonadaceae bacterium]|nr:efflux RND transporter permease subunit [Gemmatimonadaceae bacterium]